MYLGTVDEERDLGEVLFSAGFGIVLLGSIS